MEDILQFNFKVELVRGEINGVSDYLSRLCRHAAEDPDYPRNVPQSLYAEQGHVAKMVGGDVVDMDILSLVEAGERDPEYKGMIQQLKLKTPFSDLPENHILHD